MERLTMQLPSCKPVAAVGGADQRLTDRSAKFTNANLTVFPAFKPPQPNFSNYQTTQTASATPQ